MLFRSGMAEDAVPVMLQMPGQRARVDGTVAVQMNNLTILDADGAKMSLTLIVDGRESLRCPNTLALPVRRPEFLPRLDLQDLQVSLSI